MNIPKVSSKKNAAIPEKQIRFRKAKKDFMRKSTITAAKASVRNTRLIDLLPTRVVLATAKPVSSRASLEVRKAG